MDDLTRHRKRRLQALIDAKPFEGNRSSFAERVGLSKGRITQLLGANEPFGENAGMKMAAALGLKDDRYFERPFDSEKDSVVVVAEGGEEVEALRALKVLADALTTLDKATRSAVAPLLSLLAQEPDQFENIATTLGKLLPGTNLERIPKDDESAGREISAVLPSLERKELQGHAKRISNQGRGRT